MASALDTQVVTADLDDGPVGETSIGAIVLANDMVSEQELRSFLPDNGVNLYVTRIPCELEGSQDVLRRLGDSIPDAARLLVPTESLDAVIFSCTAGTAFVGPERIQALIQAVRPGCQVITPLTAATEALAHLRAANIALLSPYPPDVHEFMVSYYEGRGFRVSASATYGLRTEDEVRRISPSSLLEQAARLVHPGIDAVFISCTSLRCSPMLAALEERCRTPVVTSNQASAWRALKAAGSQQRPELGGRLFSPR